MKILRSLFFCLISISVFSQESFPNNGVKSTFSPIYAFTNAHLIISPEKEIINGILLIQDDKIIAADSIVDIPKGAIIKDVKGDYIYPSFIDLYSDYGLPKAKRGEYNYRPQYESKKNGAFHWNEAIHPEINSAEQFVYNNKQAENYINSGFGVVLSHKQDGISRGTAVLVSLANQKEQKILINDKAASCFSFRKGVSMQKYPTSLMGSIALLKQLFLDSDWHKNSNNTTNLSFNAFNNQFDLPHLFETSLVTDYNRIYQISDEFEIDFIIKGNGKEYQRIQEIKSYEYPIILPLNFPLKYDINNPEESDILTLSKLKHWETAPFNPRILSEIGINFCFTMTDIEKPSDFLNNLRTSIKKGLTKRDALQALTLTPATLINEENRLGTLEEGKKANFIICSSDIFENGEIYENWTNGIQNIINEKTKNDIRGYYTFTSENTNKTLNILGEISKLKMEEVTSDSTYIKYEIEVNGDNIIFNTADISIRGTAYFSDGIFTGI